MSSPVLTRAARILVGVVGAVGCTFPDVRITEGTSTGTTTGGAGTGAAPTTGGSGGAAAGGAQGGSGNQTGGDGGSGGAPCETGNRCDCDGDGEDAVSCAGLDCDDYDEDVFSTQTDWFDEPRSDGTYDYNCSGGPEYLHPTIVCAAPLCITTADPGFLVDTEAQNPVPCSATASYGTCVAVTCKNVTNPALQQMCH